MLMNRVKDVKAMPGYRLDVVFRNGERGVFDCNPYRGYECLAGIWADGAFEKVVADHGTVMWPNGADLCPDEVYDVSQKSGISVSQRQVLERCVNETRVSNSSEGHLRKVCENNTIPTLDSSVIEVCQRVSASQAACPVSLAKEGFCNYFNKKTFTPENSELKKGATNEKDNCRHCHCVSTGACA